MPLVEGRQGLTRHVDVDDVLEDVRHVVEVDAWAVVADEPSIGGHGGDPSVGARREATEGAIDYTFGRQRATVMGRALASDGMSEQLDKLAPFDALHVTQRGPRQELRFGAVLHKLEERLGHLIVRFEEGLIGHPCVVD